MKNREMKQSKSTTCFFPETRATVGGVAARLKSECWFGARHFFAPQVAMSFLAGLLLTLPVYAQRQGSFNSQGTALGSNGGAPSARASLPGGPGLQPGTQPSTASFVSTLQPLPGPQVIEDEDCLPWEISAIRGATVSVMRLQIPSKARSEFDKACNDVRKRRLEDGEQHARNAVEAYPNYVAAWVLLGQILEGLQQTEQARDACSHALNADPTYLPPYLCLAGISAHAQQWSAVLDLTDLIIGFGSAGDAYGYFFRATAYFNLHKIAEAEKNALAAEGVDRGCAEPAVFFLLAQIYEAEGHLDMAAEQIRRCLKTTANRQESLVAKQYLARLEKRQVLN